MNGDGPARYNIIHFKQVSAGKYRWIRVGEYVEGELRLNMSGKQKLLLFLFSVLLMYPIYFIPCGPKTKRKLFVSYNVIFFLPNIPSVILLKRKVSVSNRIELFLIVTLNNFEFS